MTVSTGYAPACRPTRHSLKTSSRRSLPELFETTRCIVEHMLLLIDAHRNTQSDDCGSRRSAGGRCGMGEGEGEERGISMEDQDPQNTHAYNVASQAMTRQSDICHFVPVKRIPS